MSEEANDDQIDRVILQDDVKLYRQRVVLAYLDGPVFDFGPTDVTFEQDPVPVYADDGRTHLGFAKVVEKVGAELACITADLVIDYASEERLLAETRSRQIYPRRFGVFSCASMPLFDFQAPILATKLHVHGIVLSRQRPRDERVQALGEPVL